MKLGVIGTSDISRQFIAGALEAGFTWTALCSRSEETASRFVESCKTAIPSVGRVRLFTELSLMAACSEVDAVYIATPPALHFAQTMTAIREGKHVLVEKPCFSTTAQTLFAMEAAKDRGVYLLETLRLFYSPLTAQLVSALPQIGEVRYVTLNYMRYSSKYDDYKRGVLHPSFSSELGGGALSDLCVYCVYLALLLFGKPDRVQHGGVRLTSGADGASTVLLGYPGFNCVINGCKTATTRLPSEILGEKGSLLIDSPFMRGSIHFQGGGSPKRELFRQDFNDMVTQQQALLRILQGEDKEKLERAQNFMLDSTAILEQCR